MKTFSILWSFVLTTLIFTSCEMEELARPAMVGQSDINDARRGGESTGVVTYSGQSTGINATIMNTQSETVTSYQTILAQTALLPAAGGTLSASDSLATIEGVLTTETLTASTSGQNNQTVSAATATNLNITVGGNVITADYVSANATATCTTTSGTSQIQNLVVNGTTVTITGAANQTIYLADGRGFVIINEKSTNKKVKAKNISVTALHVIVPNAADIRVATARAQIKC